MNKKTGKGYRKYTYIYSKTVEDSFYPAANGGYLDGLVGCELLSKFKANNIELV
jgi:hypothetical protein